MDKLKAEVKKERFIILNIIDNKQTDWYSYNTLKVKEDFKNIVFKKILIDTSMIMSIEEEIIIYMHGDVPFYTDKEFYHIIMNNGKDYIVSKTCTLDFWKTVLNS